MPGVGRGITRAHPRLLRPRAARPHESPGPPSAARPSQTTQGAEFEIVSGAIGTAAAWLAGAHDSAETHEPAADHADRADALATLGCPAAPAARPPGRPWVGVGKGSRGPWRLREEGSGRGGNTHARRCCRADSRGIFLRIIAPPPTRPAPLPSPPISPPTSTTIPTDNLPSNRLPPIIPTSAAPHTWHSRSKASRATGRQAVRAPRFSAVRAWLEPECTDSPSRGVPLIRGSPAVRARFQIRGRPDAIATART